MNQNLTDRKATIADLRTIVNLLLEDELGQIKRTVFSKIGSSLY
jgi:hypothetical protein